MMSSIIRRSSNVTDVHGLIASRCLESETCAIRWRVEVWRISHALEEAGLIKFYEEEVLTLEPWVLADENQVWEPEAVLQAQAELGDWIRGRPAKLETYIDR